MNWELKYNEYLNYSKEELEKIGCENGSKLIEMMDNYYGDQDISFAKFMKIYGSISAIDWEINEKEYALFRKITGVSASFNEFKEAVENSYNIDVMKTIDEFIDSHEEFKPLVINLGLVISAYDGNVSLEERAILEKYYN